MSGYILNPFSADFNPTSSVTYSTNGIPILAYGLIGITSLTLAYVTLLEKSSSGSSSSGINSPSVSATSMLPFNVPSMAPTTPTTSATTPTSSIIGPPAASPPKTGGKSRRSHKKHHKSVTKRRK